MCKCVNVPMGSYANQSTVTTPAGKIIGIDNCIVDEIKDLWELDIVIIESCCGHNVVPGYITVDDSSICKMKALGYKHRPNDMYPERIDDFYPKSNTDGRNY